MKPHSGTHTVPFKKDDGTNLMYFTRKKKEVFLEQFLGEYGQIHKAPYTFSHIREKILTEKHNLR